MKRSDLAFALNIIEAAGAIRSYTHGMSRAEFDRSPMVIDAVTKRVEMIGEASKELSNEFRLAYPKIEWRKIWGMRDKLAHRYWNVNKDILWSVVKTHARRLAAQLSRGPVGLRRQSPARLDADIAGALIRAEKKSRSSPASTRAHARDKLATARKKK